MKETKTQIAKRLGAAIDAHLKRFEADRKINAPEAHKRGGLTPYYNAGAVGDRHRVRIVYISFQGGRHLSVEDAARYLTWLDAGNVGRHHEALQKKGQRS